MKIRINMDEGWRFWPEYPGDFLYDNYGRGQPMTLEVPNEFIERYNTAYREFQVIHSKMEELYRLQQGLDHNEKEIASLNVKRLIEPTL
jgi:hypothetical protein